MGFCQCQPHSSEIVLGFVANSATATGLEWQAPAAGGGKVLQVVSSTIIVEKNITTTTLTDTDITATITPTLNTSKILVLISSNCHVSASNAERAIGAQLMRDSTVLTQYGNYGYQSFYNTGSTFFQLTVSGSISHLDSPATTSATTYKVQAKLDQTGAGGTSSWQYDTAPSTITLLEIGA